MQIKKTKLVLEKEDSKASKFEDEDFFDKMVRSRIQSKDLDGEED